MKEYVTKALVCLFAAVLLAGTLTGCGGANSSSNKAPEKVVIGINSVPSPHIVAIENGYFEEFFGDDVTVEVVDFATSRDGIQAMMSGDVDFVYAGCIAGVTGIANGLEGEIIWVDNAIGTTEAIAVRDGSGIDSLEDLKGHKVATPFVSTSHYILEYALKSLREQGIDTDDVELLDMQPDEIYAAWSRKDIDAAAVWDPTLSKLEGGKLIYSGEDVTADSYPVTNICLVSDEFAEAYPEYVVKYIEALEKANQLYIADEAEVISTVAEGLEISEDDAVLQMKGIDWVSAEEQLSKQYFGGDLVDNLMGVANYLYEGGNLTEPVSVDTMKNALDPSYLEKLLGK